MANAHQHDVLLACRVPLQQPSSRMPPSDIFCPVSRRLMTEPVTLLNTGAVLSRSSLQAWLRAGGHSPFSWLAYWASLVKPGT